MASTSLPPSKFHLNLTDGNLIAPRSLAAKGVWETYILALKPLQYKKTEKNQGFFLILFCFVFKQLMYLFLVLLFFIFFLIFLFFYI